MKMVFKIEEYEIIGVGDSAGGNLIAVLQNWLIVNKQKGIELKFPKALLLNYPGELTSV